ncbi:Fe2+ transport system protein A [Paucilactobacillus suebicus DSM 5007 = KCTC 3549]|uniref:Fe2+ transport system protein A n=1 Tax=Paucilactobacillus suebicus DSM 5007 = KCTC 3549 TaxID=1423807 RepID=A0A0R1W4G8_9LACO|nr:Fe2+ transport system protein A [Paucilactobacillus suebicus DSM 5007 = KCTC 3549]
MIGGRTLKTLAELNRRGNYIIIGVKGDHKLTKRLSEMGIIAGKSVTVIATSSGPMGMMIYFQGQRLAISKEVAEKISVRNISDDDDVELQELAELHVGESGIVVKLVGSKQLRKRLLDMGLTRGTMLKINQIAPLGDPIELLIRGYKLSLRKADAQSIMIEKV